MSLVTKIKESGYYSLVIGIGSLREFNRVVGLIIFVAKSSSEDSWVKKLIFGFKRIKSVKGNFGIGIVLSCGKLLSRFITLGLLSILTQGFKSCYTSNSVC